MISDSMQMYLVTIAREQDHQIPVPLSELSRVLSISPVSANEMCRKMQDSGMVSYLPYKGVSLTDEGEQLARSILRKHRLWEVFLVENSGWPMSMPTSLPAIWNTPHRTGWLITWTGSGISGSQPGWKTHSPVRSAPPEKETILYQS